MASPLQSLKTLIIIITKLLYIQLLPKVRLLREPSFLVLPWYTLPILVQILINIHLISLNSLQMTMKHFVLLLFLIYFTFLEVFPVAISHGFTSPFHNLVEGHEEENVEKEDGCVVYFREKIECTQEMECVLVIVHMFLFPYFIKKYLTVSELPKSSHKHHTRSKLECFES